MASIASLSLVMPAIAGAATATESGPSTTTPPYLLPVVPGATTTSVLTVGDHVGDYTMVGIPDGLGAYDNGDGTFTVLINHELGVDKGVIRDHGAAGAFVSKWVVDSTTLRVLSGSGPVSRLTRHGSEAVEDSFGRLQDGVEVVPLQNL